METDSRPRSGRWPAWDPERDGIGGLARYATTKSLSGVNLTVADTFVPPQATDAGAQRAAILERLWQQLVNAGYRYHREPWNADGGQRVRDARAVHRSAGTCLDVALLFAAMCKAADLRPYVAVLQEGLRGEGDHAMVVVDLAAYAHDIRPLAPGLPCAETDEPDVYAGSAGLADDGLPATTVAIDVVRALTTRGRPTGSSLADAVAAGADLLGPGRYAQALLVDVVARHASPQGAELKPADDAARPTLYPTLPPSPPFTSYTSRLAVHEQLSGLRGLVVLHGKSGVGKSMLAGALARNADEGCGWFLDASSRSTLTAALAEAELTDRGGPATGTLEPADLTANATAALQRLADAPGSWVVVLDNANGDPEKLGRLPAVRADRGQLLLVTTTNPAWRDRAGHFVALNPLTDDEVRDELDPVLPAAVTAALGGRPLLMEVSRRFREATGDWWWTSSSPDGPESGPLRFWEAVDGRLRDAVGHAARTAALAVAWLPPVPVATRVLAAAFPNVDLPAGLDLLHRLGLVESDQTGGSVQMHRLFRDAVRHDRGSATHRHLDVVRTLLMAQPIRPHLARVPDLRALGDMRDLVGDADPVLLHALATLLERHDPEQAAQWFTAMRDVIPGTGADDTQRRMVCDALRGQARAILRDQKLKSQPDKHRAQLDDGIDRMRLAFELTHGREPWDDRLTASRTEAMLGLLLRQRGGLEPDPARALELLTDAGDRLRRSAAGRVALYDEIGVAPGDAADVDRSEFNLAGLALRLAQREPMRAAAHLSEAQDIYGRVGELRFRRYGIHELEEVVCCTFGHALVDYYRAVLLPGTVAAKYALLRRAYAYAHESVERRVAIAGPVDDGNTAKSFALTAKIALARLALRSPGEFRMPPDLDDFEKREVVSLLAGIRSVEDTSATPVSFAPALQVGSSPDLVADIARWIAEPPLTALVSAFGDDPAVLTDPALSLTERLAGLEVVSRRWDTRIDPVTGRRRERNEAGELVLTAAQADLVLSAAEALGMREVRPPRHRTYDHVVLLGGLVRACLNRTAYAARLIADGVVATHSVVALGGHRPFRGDEFTVAAEAGHPGLSEEFEALDLGARLAFRLSAAEHAAEATSELIGGAWSMRRYRTPGGLQVAVAAAPSSEPEQRRANTADSYEWWGRELVRLQEGQRVLAITSSIYVNAQQSAALQTLALPHGVEVETVGTGAGAPGVPAKIFTPTQYLQEIRSAVHALQELLAALDGDR